MSSPIAASTPRWRPRKLSGAAAPSRLIRSRPAWPGLAASVAMYRHTRPAAGHRWRRRVEVGDSLLTMPVGPAPAIRDLLAAGQQSFSFEFMPPKTEAEEQRLWLAIRQLEPLRPTFVSVTYGAGGSTRDRTVRVTGRIAEETTLTPLGHLTAVNHSVADLKHVIR